jgi:hypothetical protein
MQKERHKTLFSAHKGVVKTSYKVTQNYWWHSLDKDIGKFIKPCGKCQETKTLASYIARIVSFITNLNRT